MGVIALGHHDPAAVAQKAIDQVKASTDRPFGVNVRPDAPRTSTPGSP